MRLARARRDQPAEVADVDDLRALGRVVVDLLVGPRREEAREASSPPAAGRVRARPPAIETMSCSAMPHSMNRSGYRSSKARTPAVGGEVAVEHDESRDAARPARPAPRRTPRRRTRRGPPAEGGRRVGRPAPRPPAAPEAEPLEPRSRPAPSSSSLARAKRRRRPGRPRASGTGRVRPPARADAP